LVFIFIHFITHLTCLLALILLCKHAASLGLSGLSPKLALTQADSDFQQGNVISTIKQSFPASYEEYTQEQFITFLKDVNIGLFNYIYILIMANTGLESSN